MPREESKQELKTYLNHLHSSFGGKRALDNGVLVESSILGKGLASIFGIAGKLEGLGKIEVGLVVNLADLLLVLTLHFLSSINSYRKRKK